MALERSDDRMATDEFSDIMMTCTPHVPGERAFRNAVPIVESHSPINADDIWESIGACATLPSMAAILVVVGERRHAQVVLKGPRGPWPDTGGAVEAESIVRRTSGWSEMPMAEIQAELAVDQSLWWSLILVASSARALAVPRCP